MPLVHIQMRDGKPESYRRRVLTGIYKAMREALDVPEGDHFMSITEHEASNFFYGDAFGVTRSDDLLYIQITVFSARTQQDKEVLIRRIAEILEECPGVRREDVFVNLYAEPPENWSVGNGVQFGH